MCKKKKNPMSLNCHLHEMFYVGFVKSRSDVQIERKFHLTEPFNHFITLEFQRFRVHTSCHVNHARTPQIKYRYDLCVLSELSHCACSPALELLVKTNWISNLSPCAGFEARGQGNENREHLAYVVFRTIERT